MSKMIGKLRVHDTINGLRDANGNTLIRRNEVERRVREYTKDLYSYPDRTCWPVQISEHLSGIPISTDEVVHAK